MSSRLRRDGVTPLQAATVECTAPIHYAAVHSYTPAQLWHLLSLDAPTVAALWTLFLARCAGVPLPWPCAGGLFVAVWMLYAADRLLDAFAEQRRGETDGALGTQLEERHRFHWKHRGGFLAGLAIASVLLAAVLPKLGPRTTLGYTGLGLVLLLWLARVHGPGKDRSATLPKELMVGPFFGFAIAVPTLARSPELAWWIWPCAGLLATVCSLNCVLLYAWEHDDLLPGKAHASTIWAVHHVRSIGAALIAAGLTLAALIGLHVSMPGTSGQLAEFPLACALATWLLLLLDRESRRFDRLTLRTAADVALLAPLLFPALLRR